MAPDTENSSARPETREGYWWRILRPLLWWLLLVLLLFAVHQHEVAMERTRLYFSVTMYETNVLNDAVATLDGRQIANGDKISLGSHRLVITQPKGETFTTNFMSWYGRHDFGTINLKRAMGTLNVVAEPTAKMITITGPEFSLTLNDSTGTSLLVPTDMYQVSAQFAHWSGARDYRVTPGNITHCVFAPQLGAISLTCNEFPATFEVQDTSGDVIERGDVPRVVTELPAGRYSVSVLYHNHTLRQEVVASAKETNAVPFHFAFGAVRFESIPSGASVYTTNGIYLGTTPVAVTELPPSTADYRLQLNGYDGATVSAEVVENQTNVASVTLVSLSYLGSMRTAKEDLAAGHYRNASASVEQALAARPGDADALNLQTMAKGRGLIQEAKDLANQGDYIEAGEKLQAALETMPNDVEIKSLQADYKQHEAGELVKTKARHTRETFDLACKARPDASLFEEHDVTITNMSPEAFRDAFVHNCETAAPTFKVLVNRSAENGICELFLTQGADLLIIAVRTECVMVIGKGGNDQTVVLFKVMNYQRRTANLGSMLSGNANPSEWVPLHPSRIQWTDVYAEQIRVGVRMILNKIHDMPHQKYLHNSS